MRIPRIPLIAAAAYAGLVAGAYWPRSRPTTPVAALLGDDDRFVMVERDRLRYRHLGDGPPVVLIHGFAGSAYTWRSLAPLLAADHSVYAIDLLGFGLSDKPARADHSLDGHGRRVAAAIAALGLREATLVGHSMGGVVAAYAAGHDAEGRIARLALLDANFYQRNGPPIPLPFPLPRLIAQRFYDPAGRLASLRRCYHDQRHLSEEVIANYLAPTTTMGAIEALTAFLATPGPATYAQLPPQIRRPTLILWGAQDQLWPLDDATRLQHAIPGARAAIIPQAGHMLQEEQPAAVARALVAFEHEGRSDQPAAVG